MEMRILRDNINMEQLIGSNQTQAVVEGEITLPGGLREEAKVLHAGGMVVLKNAESMADRVNIDGKVVFHVLYTQGDPNKILSIEAAADFSHTVDLPGALPKMLNRTEAAVEHTEATCYNGRMALKAILQLSTRLLSPAPVSVVTGLQDVEGLELQAQTLPVQRTVAQGTGDSFLREELELADALQVQDTLFATAQAGITELSGGQGRANVNGNVQLEVYHTSDMPNRPLVITRHSIPFEQAVDLSGPAGDLLSGEVSVSDVAVVSQDAGDGSRILRCEIQLKTGVWSDVRESVTILDDAYTTDGNDLALDVKRVTFRNGDNRCRAAESGKLMLMLPEGSPASRTVLAGFVTPVLTGKEQVGGRLNVEGILEITLLYMTDDSPAAVTLSMEEPFQMTFALKTEAEDFLSLTASDINLSGITSDRVEMKYILHVNVNGISASTQQIVSDAEQTPALKASGGIALYYVQPGEGLWDIAQHYRIKREQLLSLNPALASGDLTPGQSILVFKREAK